jgi:CheY-like chemotaxis protein
MGKKILVDAGYKVLTVSNGLEALRKIAETIPDIAILDIFMPGYTGLELCERLRASAATATLPVILTVGKLEPYRPEDGEHVHSNAVIVKPFAAAELISAVRSLIGAPPVVGKTDPELAGGSHAAAAGLEEGGVAASAVSQDPSAGLGEETPDEPLFSDTSRSVYGTDSVSSDAESDGPESLMFNPDAAHTPFRASVADPEPSASHSPAENGASAFTEFDLEPEQSDYSSAPELETSVTEESWSPAPFPTPLSTPLATRQEATGATGPAVEARSVASEAGLVAPEKAVEEEEGATDSTGLVESESSIRDIPNVDPLLEARDEAIPTGESMLDILDLGTAPEGGSTSTSEQLAQDEEARRIAFEELFNSPDPIPVEDSPFASAGNSVVTLPSMADLSKDHPYEAAPDSEIDMDDDKQRESIAQESDPYLEEEGPLSATAVVTQDPDLILENPGAENWAKTSRGPGVSVSAVVDDTVSPEPDLTPAPVEASSDSVEAVSAVTETVEPSAEILQVAQISQTDSEPALSQSVLEVAHSAVQEAVEVAPAVPEALEPRASAEIAEAAFDATQSQSVSEIVPAAVEQAAPELAQSELESDAVEASPVQPASEQEVAFAPPEQSPAAQPEAETHAAVVSSAPEAVLNEAERIEQAVQTVFDRFKPLLVEAIVRELARHD